MSGGNGNGWLGFLAGLMVGRHGRRWGTLILVLLVYPFVVVTSWLQEHPTQRTLLGLLVVALIVLWICRWINQRDPSRMSFMRGTRRFTGGNDRDRTALYRWFDGNGELLYVGISNNLLRRTGQHFETKEWMHEVATATVEHFSTRVEALVAEKNAIRREHPRYNIQHNGSRRVH